MPGENESVTFETARKCPKCEEPGREDGVRSLGRQGRLVTIRCMNKVCKWFNTTWIVQVRPDGTVPAPDTRPRLASGPQVSQEDIDRVLRNAERTHQASMKPGGELRGR